MGAVGCLNSLTWGLVSSQLPVFHNLNPVFWGNQSKTIFLLSMAGNGEWEGSAKIISVTCVQQATNYTLERDMDYLFQSCASLGVWWYSTKQAQQPSKIFTICAFQQTKELVFISYKLQSSFINQYSLFCELMMLSLLMLISPHAQSFSSFGSGGFLGPWSRSAPAGTAFYPAGADLAQLAFQFSLYLGTSATGPCGP